MVGLQTQTLRQTPRHAEDGFKSNRVVPLEEGQSNHLLLAAVRDNVSADGVGWDGEYSEYKIASSAINAYPIVLWSLYLKLDTIKMSCTQML